MYQPVRTKKNIIRWNTQMDGQPSACIELLAAAKNSRNTTYYFVFANTDIAQPQMKFRFGNWLFCDIKCIL